MCGIAGILTERPDVDLEPALARMQAALSHRGPDGSSRDVFGLPHGRRLGFAHTRLAIQDLTPAGRQPMHDPRSGNAVVFNGEIYNHGEVRRTLPATEWRSTGDTETLLRGWAVRGADICTSLRGMFAFAMLDRPRGRLWLVRDRMGVKPLYMAGAGPGTWLFASEVRAILASGLVNRTVDRAGLQSLLAFGAVSGPLTLVEGVRSLMPGRRCWFDLDAAVTPDAPLAPRQETWWHLPFRRHDADDKDAPRSRAEAVERLRPVLDEAVRLRMVADVPVGVFLSGGLDSGAIVSSLSSSGRRPHTFSVVFGEREFDERDAAAATARRFDTVHAELPLSAADVLRDLPSAISAYDQPGIDGINTWFVSRAARDAGVKVALSGLGGDEFFAGYPHFRTMDRLSRRWGPWAARLELCRSRLTAPQAVRTGKLAMLLRHRGDALERCLVGRLLFTGAQRRRMSDDWDEASPVPADGPFSDVPSAALPDPPASLLRADAGGLDPVNAQSLCEASLYLSDMLLRDGDQMSMAHALELREPLLDHVLIGTVAAMPGPWKLQPGALGSAKGLLMDALPAPLPDEVVRGRKRGFVFPWESWIRGPLRPMMEETLSDAGTARAAGLRPGAVRSLWETCRDGRPGVRANDCLLLCNLFHWLRATGVTAA